MPNGPIVRAIPGAVALQGNVLLVPAVFIDGGASFDPSPQSASLTGPQRAAPSPLASTLQDNFDDNSIDPAKWVSAGFYEAEATGGTVSETNQRIEVTGVGSASRAAGYVSASSVDLTNDAIFVKISNTATFSADQVAYLAFGPNNNSYYMFIVWPGAPNLLIGRRRVNGTNTDLFSITYSATTHAWLRIRHQASDNTIHFDTATSSASSPPLAGDWTDQGSETFTSSFAVNNGSAAIGSATFTSDPSPGTAYLDGFNTATTTGTTYNDTLSESAAGADSLNPAGSTFGVPLSETAASADVLASTQGFVNTLAENVAASDSLTGGLLLTGSVSETAAAADALANAVTWGPAQTEGAAANDSLANSATFGSALGETAATSDSLAAGNVIAATRAESAAAADSEAASQTYVSSLTETAASADALSAGLVIAKSLNETAAAADSATVAVTFNPVLAESAAAGDVEASSQVMPNALGETSVAGDAEASKETFNVSLGESSGAGDSVSAGATTYNENISAAAAAGDAEAAATTMAAAESESAAAADAEAANSTLAGAVGEQATASDQASSAQASSAALGESAAASDSAAAAATYGGSVNENLTALASLGVGLVLPASVGETATAGDAETARADLGGTLDEQASANDDYEATVVAVITHQMAVLQAVKALVQAALPDMALGFTADSDKKARAGQREIGQARAAVEIEYEFGSNAQIFRQPIGIVLTAPGGFGGLALDDMDVAIGAAILADRTLGGLVDWLEASAATIASRSARGVASLNWATIVITAEYRTEGALAA